MKTLLLACLFLTACATQKVVEKPRVTSDSIVKESMRQCKTIPDEDMNKAVCVYSYIKIHCQMFNPDVRLCGSVLGGPQRQSEEKETVSN